jgi:uncharacterized protein YdhG (YjbR/CyaY superfamily)
MIRGMAKPKTVAAYLASATKDQRAALIRVRRTIKAAAPMAIEGVYYGIAGFKYKGKPLLYFGYAKDHCALYGGVALGGADAKRFDLDKGTLRFTTEHPVPDRLVTKIVKSRIAEIDRAD